MTKELVAAGEKVIQWSVGSEAVYDDMCAVWSQNPVHFSQQEVLLWGVTGGLDHVDCVELIWGKIGVHEIFLDECCVGLDVVLLCELFCFFDLVGEECDASEMNLGVFGCEVECCATDAASCIEDAGDVVVYVI